MIVRYVGATRTQPGQGTLIVPDNIVAYNNVNALKGFLMVDLSANYQFTKTFTAFSTINNLTNNNAIVANLPNGSRPNMPIGIMLGLKVVL